MSLKYGLIFVALPPTGRIAPAECAVTFAAIVASGRHSGAWEVVLGDRKRNFELTLCDVLAAPSTPDSARHRQGSSRCVRPSPRRHHRSSRTRAPLRSGHRARASHSRPEPTATARGRSDSASE
jgi:hypothetical protein